MRQVLSHGAITLVFGTARRGVELPQLDGQFQTSVPGIYIAGELGGMGLIRNAVEQGRQAVEAISSLPRPAGPDTLDLVIVGAGPAGIAAALAAKSRGMSYAVIEQDDLGGTVFKYPRGKIVMTAPVSLPLVGLVKLRETTKEALLDLWRNIERTHRLNIHYRERVEDVRRTSAAFEIVTNHKTWRAGRVLLATGRRGTPRTLDVAGEQHPKVVYQLIDPEQYAGCKVLVVGGGDSALEAAASLAGVKGTAVSLSYRAGSFSRARAVNRERVNALASKGTLHLLMSSTITEIHPSSVNIRTPQGDITLPNDAVIVCAGGVLPSEFLRRTGIETETKYGTP